MGSAARRARQAPVARVDASPRPGGRACLASKAARERPARGGGARGGRSACGNAALGGASGGSGGGGGCGGQGGYGGGGSGGPSIGIAHADDEQLTLDRVTFEIGPGGRGGIADVFDETLEKANRGGDGFSAETMRFAP
ncbi:hypothetical protein WMF28_06640 [Sorangium sp. So ce590]|uniref:hypothetical protein n=1 Tax=Sorangium sp. So ce590 TaxID=3133317 RepID=UPI003F5F3AC4